MFPETALFWREAAPPVWRCRPGRVEEQPETMSRPKSIEIGDIVAGKYRLLAMIGEGGMGVVYLAEHSLIEKRVALKVLRAEYSRKPELVSRFQQEAISASRIKHPNVLDVFDFGQLEDGSFFLAMEYLSGRDLAGELTESGTVAPDRAVRIALQMCRALAAAHARGVVHRDLKPENVFLHLTEDADEVVKIVDFGIAQLKGKEEKEEGTVRRRRLTRTGMIFGTPEYMSPEQAKGISVDLRSDIYALGVILYEMVTGAVPFTGTTFMAVLTAHMTQPVPPIRAIAPDTLITNELEQTIMRSLEKTPEKRFQSMRELAAALQKAPEGRIAAPLGGLLPLPEVNVGSFRPARPAGAATSPQFEPLDPLPIDLVSRTSKAGAGELRGGDAQDSTNRDSPNTHITRSGVATISAEISSVAETDSAHRGRRSRLALVGVALLALVGITLAFRHFGGRARSQLAQPLVIHAPLPSGARPSLGADLGMSPAASNQATETPIAASASHDVAARSQPNPAPNANGASTKAVVLTVQSNLPGAIVTKDGFQVCDQTPCTVEVPRGAGVELVGIKGYARGVAKVLAQQDQTVNIVLTYAKAGGKRQDGGKPGLCEVTVDGLKILRPCQ
jgi:serine/threonine protein kinase